MDAENRETVLREYTRNLHEADLLRLGEELVELDSEEGRVDEERKLSAAKFSSELKRIKGDMKRLLRMYRTKEEIIEEECNVKLDFESGLAEYYSVETGHLVDTRKITQDERQLELFSRKQKKSKEEDCSEDKVPVCHMKEMTLIHTELDGSYFECEQCGCKKTKTE